MSIPTFNSSTIPVITLPPNWADAVRWSQRYETTITEALDLSEERQARFPRPLYSLSYTTVGLSAAETAYLRRVIETADDLPVACPLWPVACKLTSAAAAGATSLAIDDSTGCLFTVFYQYALLWEDFETWEVVELSTVAENSATLAAALAGSYSTAAKLIPLAYGKVPRGNIEQLTDEHGKWECRFEETFHRLHDQSLSEGSLPDAPTAPSDLVATAVDGDSISLSWTDNSLNETGFVIERQSGVVWLQVGVAGSNTNTFTDTGLTAFTAYTYRVYARNSGGNSAVTSTASATTLWDAGTTYGDDFDSYDDGDAGTLDDGTGFDGDWIF